MVSLKTNDKIVALTNIKKYRNPHDLITYIQAERLNDASGNSLCNSDDVIVSTGLRVCGVMFGITQSELKHMKSSLDRNFKFNSTPSTAEFIDHLTQSNIVDSCIECKVKRKVDSIVSI